MHPVLWSIDDEHDDGLLVIRYPHFETAEPLVSDCAGTDVTTDAVIEHGLTHQWNHGTGEIVTALLDAGLTITGLAEHASTPFDALPGQMAEGGDGEWRLVEDPAHVPCTFTMQAVKQA
jgi:hypothetical protein